MCKFEKPKPNIEDIIEIHTQICKLLILLFRTMTIPWHLHLLLDNLPTYIRTSTFSWQLKDTCGSIMMMWEFVIRYFKVLNPKKIGIILQVDYTTNIYHLTNLVLAASQRSQNFWKSYHLGILIHLPHQKLNYKCF